MQELIQLLLSIFFGLLPLWIFLGRMRARRQRSAAGTATASKGESGESADAPPPSSVWPYQQWYQVTTSPEDHRVLVETNAQSTQEYTNTEAPPEDASIVDESTTQDFTGNTLDDTPDTTLDTTLDDTLDTTLESTVFTPDEDSGKELRPKDDTPTKKGGEQSNILMPNIVSLSSSELRRAIIVSEILAPPLSLRDAQRLP